MTKINSKKEILFAGDTYFGEAYTSTIQRVTNINLVSDSYDHFCERLLPLVDEADIFIANLETALTDLSSSPYQDMKQYIIRGDPSKTINALAKLNVGYVSLANNHSGDFGAQGLIQTMESLNRNKVKNFGAGRNPEEAAQPLFLDVQLEDLSVPIIFLAGYEYNNSYDHKYDFYAQGDSPGVNILTVDDVVTQVKSLRHKHPQAFIICYPHWGRNYKWKSKRQTAIAHAMVEAGADLIIGHGAHALQEIEQYKEKWIVYSLGNFIFNTPGRYYMKNYPPYSMVARLTLENQDNRQCFSIKLYPIVSDNRMTGYQPRLVSEQEFSIFNYSLNMRRIKHKQLEQPYLNTGKDSIGFFLETAL